MCVFGCSRVRLSKYYDLFLVVEMITTQGLLGVLLLRDQIASRTYFLEA